MKRSEVQREKLSPMMQQYMDIKINTKTVLSFLDLVISMKCFLKMPLSHPVY